MIDPKMVELVLFNEIPHLIAPVVTDSKKAATVLNWAVLEMERRYRRLSELGARNIEGYNQKAPPTPNEQGHGHMPYLVVVIDELADLMMVSAREVEGSIARLAQMARAVGIHVIIATQRPSVDVITGVIKANFPARIAFQVASKVDSRTILDVNGADKMLGRGDMLFLKPGSSKPVRAQAAYLSDGEIERVVSHLKSQRQPTYDEDLMNQPNRSEGGAAGGDYDKDEMYEQAKDLIISTGQASTSLLQRRLRLGYGRAARILDMMEQEGIVGPPQGSRPREVLVGHHSEQRG
jgi:S-DNA-T family DNA segregation ATPase FtsK/SpoIIIE